MWLLAAAGFARDENNSRENFRQALYEQFFLMLERFVGIHSPAPRTQQIESHLDALHQRRSFPHRAPETRAELRSGVLLRFERSRQNPVGMNKLSPQTVGGLRENAVHLLRLPSCEVNNVRSVRHHAGNLRLRII